MVEANATGSVTSPPWVEGCGEKKENGYYRWDSREGNGKVVHNNRSSSISDRVDGRGDQRATEVSIITGAETGVRRRRQIPRDVTVSGRQIKKDSGREGKKGGCIEVSQGVKSAESQRKIHQGASR